MKIHKLILMLLSLMIFCGCASFETASSTGIVIVGMSKSAKYGKCVGADQDVIMMNDILSKYGHPTVLLNGQGTKANVLNAMRVASKNDLMIFYFSGHGGSEFLGDVSDEVDRKNEFICLNDTYLLDNEIWDVVSKAKNRVFLIFDCCHSETMFRERGISLKMLSDETLLKSASENKVRLLCWSGCADDKLSYGDEFGGKFTNAIRHSYNKNYSYNKVWVLTLNEVANPYQLPKRTEIGKKFSGRIFR